MLCIIIVLLNLPRFSSDVFYVRLMAAACGCVAASMLVTWFAVEKTVRLEKRHNRYSYVDIGVKTAVYSRYAGEIHGDSDVIRELWVISLPDMTACEAEKKTGKVRVTSKIRKYTGRNSRLGYHFEKGELVFNNAWFTEAGFTEHASVVIPSVFIGQEKLASSLIKAKEHCENLPPPVEYKFHEADFIRRRVKKRVLPDDFNYSRKW